MAGTVEIVETKAVADWRTWVTALRSGKYKQGTGYLRSHKGYCCWGVACDLIDPNEWEGSEDGIMAFGKDGYEGMPLCLLKVIF